MSDQHHNRFLEDALCSETSTKISLLENCDGNYIVRRLVDGHDLETLLHHMVLENTGFLHNLSIIFEAFRSGDLWTLTPKDSYRVYPCLMVTGKSMTTIEILWVYSKFRRIGLGRALATHFPVKHVSSVVRDSIPFWEKLGVSYDRVIGDKRKEDESSTSSSKRRRMETTYEIRISVNCTLRGGKAAYILSRYMQEIAEEDEPPQPYHLMARREMAVGNEDESTQFRIDLSKGFVYGEIIFTQRHSTKPITEAEAAGIANYLRRILDVALNRLKSRIHDMQNSEDEDGDTEDEDEDEDEDEHE